MQPLMPPAIRWACLLVCLSAGPARVAAAGPQDISTQALALTSAFDGASRLLVRGRRRGKEDNATLTAGAAVGPAPSGRPKVHLPHPAGPDSRAVLSSLTLATVCVGVCLLGFPLLLRAFPDIYAYHEKSVATGPYFSWALTSVKVRPDMAKTQRRLGLDNAMAIEFCTFAQKLLALLGAVTLVGLAPIYYSFAVGVHEEGLLDQITIKSLGHRRPPLWFAAGATWVVVILTQQMIFSAMRRFSEFRKMWLITMPAAQAATVLIKGIPEGYRGDQELKGYFSELFTPQSIVEANVVKRADELVRMCKRLRQVEGHLADAEYKWKLTGCDPQARPQFTQLCGSERHEDALEHFGKEAAYLREAIDAERQRVRQTVGPYRPELHCESGFVRFASRREAALALQMPCRRGGQGFFAFAAPEPTDIIWRDLRLTGDRRTVKAALGCGCIILVFVTFVPCVLSITSLANVGEFARWIPPLKRFFEHRKGLQAILQGAVAALTLNTLMCQLPHIFMIILRNAFNLHSLGRAQNVLQEIFFWFHMIFTVLVTACASSLLSTLEEILMQPASVFRLLAQSMPESTNFYLNFLAMQWITHAVGLLRLPMLRKFWWLRHSEGPERARELTERSMPENLRIGALSARITVNVVICIIFCVLCPLMSLFGIVDMTICRLVQGYLWACAESRPADQGGIYWVSQLKHLQYGVIVFSILMTGVLLQRGPPGSGIATAPTVAVSFVARWYFDQLDWEAIHLEDLVEAASMGTPRPSHCASYVQPELRS